MQMSDNNILRPFSVTGGLKSQDSDIQCVFFLKHIRGRGLSEIYRESQFAEVKKCEFVI